MVVVGALLRGIALTLLLGTVIHRACTRDRGGSALCLTLSCFLFFLFLVHLGVDDLGLEEGPDVIGQHVSQQSDVPQESGEQQGCREEPQHHAVHGLHLHFHHFRRARTTLIWLLASCSLLRLTLGHTLALTAHGHACVEVGQQHTGKNQRHSHHDDVHAREISRGECRELLFRHRHVGRQRNAKHTGIKEGLDIFRREDVVRSIAVLLHRHAQTAGTSAGAVKRTQHVEQTNEHRHLHQRHNAAGQRVHVGFLVQALHLHRLLLLVLAVFLADLLHLRLEFLHLAASTQLVHHRLHQEDTDGEGEEHDRQQPRGTRIRRENVAEDVVPEPQHR